jgi:glutathione S-transferase
MYTTPAIPSPWVLQKIIPHYFTLQQSQDSASQDKARQSLYEGLRTLADRVKGPYFAGERFTVVDMSIAPFVRRFYNLEKFRNLDEKEVGEMGEWSRWYDE